jgi:hypothetical protein
MAIARPHTELLKRFTAPDPWDGDQRGTFEVYRHSTGGLMPLHAAADERSRLQTYTLRLPGGVLDRPLPDSLVALWLAGTVPDERLPWLLAGLEPRLKGSDFATHQALNPMQRAVRRWAPLVGGAFIAVLGVSQIAESVGVGLAMIVAGALIAGGAWLLGRRFSARRRNQERWILEQLRS